MAEKSGMAWTTFHRQFKRVTGLSPIQYQKELRLLEARKLLVHNDLSVREVAFQVGYESASQFNREYSRHFGSSPGKDAEEIRAQSRS
jgi:transcriptional regulator GlxA family with amidase domain